MPMSLNDLPEIQFASTDINEILNEKIANYEQVHFQETGVRKRLYPGDPMRIFIYSEALRELQLRHLINDTAKKNLLAYARDENLDHVGALLQTSRHSADYAVVSVRFVLSDVQPVSITIPEGTRVTPGGDIFFELTEPIEVPAGQGSIILTMICTQPGTAGNGFTPGQIDTIVDPLPHIDEVINTETSQGGIDRESDADFRERLITAPGGFSVAGPENAYIHLTKSFSASILDVHASTPDPGEVDIRVLLQDGDIPSSAFLNEVLEHLNGRERRPLTDLVSVSAPEQVEYELSVKYFINMENITNEDAIRERIETAIQRFSVWQRSKIGRDINPSELHLMCRQAGAKRIEIISPEFKEIGEQEIAVAVNIETEYGGLERE